MGPVQRGGPPQPVDVEHLVRDGDVGIGGHFLADQLHREQRCQVLGPDRLARARVQRWGRRRGQVRDHVVPLAGDLGLIQCDLGALGHDGLRSPMRNNLPRTVQCWSGGPYPTRVLTAAVSWAIAFFASAKNMLVLGSKYSSFSMPA